MDKVKEVGNGTDVVKDWLANDEVDVTTKKSKSYNISKVLRDEKQ